MEPLMCVPLPFLIILNLVMTLNFDLLTSKPDQFILGLKYVKVVIWLNSSKLFMKYLVHELLGHTNRRTIQKQHLQHSMVTQT